MTPPNGHINETLADQLDKIVKGLSPTELDPTALPPGDPAVEANSSRRRRRGFSPQDFNGLATLTLVDEDGLLRWDYQPPIHGIPSRRSRRRAAHPIGATVVHEFSFKETPPNKAIAALEELDRNLTPDAGLRRLQNGKFVPIRDISLQGRVLLLVHGTFSKSEMFLDELSAIPIGKDFLRLAEAKYDAILAFDHPTLSVSPWINALDLELVLAKVTGPIDVISHSRGGLVVAWWLRNAKRRVENVVFVGTPMEGTSLASPANLRSALSGLANVFKGLTAASAAASTVLPFMTIVTGLSKILGGVLQLGASTPLADAAVAIVPGLAAQSRVGNNSELDRLTRLAWISTPTVHAVVSNFAPSEADTQWWQIWKLLSRPTEKMLNWGADAIFNENNDLVVNTQSMTRLCGAQIDVGRTHDFGNSQFVHHCNYFRQPETVTLLKRAFNV
jgi:pimeloyl-ACP methyl ester carboxylesterase